VSFSNPKKNILTDLEMLHEVTDITKNGDKYSINTKNVPKVLAEIWNYATLNKLTINTLNTLCPSLQDVFVELTGINPNPCGSCKPKRSNQT